MHDGRVVGTGGDIYKLCSALENLFHWPTGKRLKLLLDLSFCLHKF